MHQITLTLIDTCSKCSGSVLFQAVNVQLMCQIINLRYLRMYQKAQKLRIAGWMDGGCNVQSSIRKFGLCCLSDFNHQNSLTICRFHVRFILLKEELEQQELISGTGRSGKWFPRGVREKHLPYCQETANPNPGNATAIRSRRSKKGKLATLSYREGRQKQTCAHLYTYK